MFIYEKNGAICITFAHNGPTDTPEYVIGFDEEHKAVVVNGKAFTNTPCHEDTSVSEEIAVAQPKTSRRTKQVVEPTVEEASEVTVE